MQARKGVGIGWVVVREVGSEARCIRGIVANCGEGRALLGWSGLVPRFAREVIVNDHADVNGSEDRALFMRGWPWAHNSSNGPRRKEGLELGIGMMGQRQS